MALLGIFLRLLYTVGVEEGQQLAWRNAAYFMLLLAVPYESFYSTILPIWIRLLLVLFLGGAVVNLLVKLQKGGKTHKPDGPGRATIHEGVKQS